jgi:tRNA (cmo5U34)-methyltransferase
MAINLWTKTDHALDYLERADSITHRTEGESSLLEFLPHTTRRILDLGTGDRWLLGLVKREHPHTEAVAIDFSPAMLDAAKKRFAGDSSVAVLTHNRLSASRVGQV